MSIERKCRTCGYGEGIRYSFTNIEDEIAFHKQDFFCKDCIDNEMDLLAKEIDDFYNNEN